MLILFTFDNQIIKECKNSQSSCVQTVFSDWLLIGGVHGHMSVCLLKIMILAKIYIN